VSAPSGRRLAVEAASADRSYRSPADYMSQTVRCRGTNDRLRGGTDAPGGARGHALGSPTADAASPRRTASPSCSVPSVSVEVAAGVVLIVAPLWFNATFVLLGSRFDYPDILRRPTTEILERFRAGGSSLILLWWTFMLSGLLLIAGAVLLGQVLGLGWIVPVATTIGVLAGVVQMLGLLRWVYVVPALARAYTDPTLGPDQREVLTVVFRALHQYLGVGVGEHLGYLFTGIWSLLIGIAVIGDGTALPVWVGWPGIVIGAGLAVGSAEFLGPNEERGWGLAGAAIPFVYIAWSVWLLAMGIALVA
jgi:Domain of unknown function (DUF4386)